MAVALTVPPAAVFLLLPITPVPVGNSGNIAVVLTPTHSVSNLYSKLGECAEAVGTAKLWRGLVCCESYCSFVAQNEYLVIIFASVDVQYLEHEWPMYSSSSMCMDSDTRDAGGTPDNYIRILSINHPQFRFTFLFGSPHESCGSENAGYAALPVTI